MLPGLQGPRRVIKQFQEDPDIKVFLLTRGQGAAGLTLTQGALEWQPLLSCRA